MALPDDPRVKHTTLRVRFAETDMMGVAHHSSYVIYLEAGRVDYMRQLGSPYSELEARGYSLAVSEMSLRILTAARFDDVLRVDTWVEEAGSRAITFGYEVRNADSDQLLVTAQVKLVCIDHNGQVRRLPQDWYDLIRPMALHP